MKTALYAAGSDVGALPCARSRWLDFVELTKPRIAVLVLFTVAIGALLTPRASLDLVQLLHALVGTALVASGASALNQWLERSSDALMRRTENRPLPGGRLSSAEVLWFGIAISIVGLGYMLFVMAHPLAAAVTVFTHLSYVFIYTPLKRMTTLNTLIGAVPGALPPVIGWTAMTGTLDWNALVLFLIVFFWQVPHFLAIAWMYREDYARADLKMLPGVDPEGTATARQMLVYTVALIVVSLLPLLRFGASLMYGFGALGLGMFFLRFVWMFAIQPAHAPARKVLHASLVYLPSVLGLLLLERWIRYMTE
ncbi:MAG: protoheme IX farnesyltransferase [Gemmataceae bacterium]|nr:protoheme IX farnesyltransferase [Gemmataceae bacterium]